MVWCILMVIMGFTHNYALMVTLRILLGIAEGPLFPLAFAVVRHTFPQRLQARATMLWLLGRRLARRWVSRCQFGYSIPSAGRAHFS